MDETHYARNLRHVVRPDDPTEREEADSVYVEDYEALYLSYNLRLIAAYDDDPKVRGIAWAYDEYIEQCVRDEGKRSMGLYAHTPEAKGVLKEAASKSDGSVTIEDSMENIVTLLEGMEE